MTIPQDDNDKIDKFDKVIKKLVKEIKMSLTPYIMGMDDFYEKNFLGVAVFHVSLEYMAITSIDKQSLKQLFELSLQEFDDLKDKVELFKKFFDQYQQESNDLSKDPEVS